ncbi:MAG: hypothetical protein HN742_23815 [Lentisphaerae bacterium]|jgi:hypothetical protein|nr:hypothetical protein [Lentisphaerota bacterium]MBT4822490.1 hypothetical protein [Lentisphaerota bacterium]MBT5612803.1 hypothetical protein [Lentisphaerota bacterium]MBT7057629.1 hypothetical protein [Lentisphaerota bacterium]MBT7844924.1 hypothetical protein [Lentisphaerota bacterium]
MNITLSAKPELIARSRALAKARGTTLNQMVRDYLTRVTSTATGVEAAVEFADLARRSAGQSPPGFRLDRDAVHEHR